MIACVLRSGGLYRPEHVQRLAAQAAVYASGQVFVCLSDVPVDGVATVPLRHGWLGWWSKLELFRPDAFPVGERVLFADLDTTFVGDIRPLLEREEPFLALADFYQHQRKRREVCGLGSGLMLWTAGTESALYHAFAARPEAVMAACGRYGDQMFIGNERPGVTFWQMAVPGLVASYKLHCRHGVPADTRVVCFHGVPKPWDVADVVAA